MLRLLCILITLLTLCLTASPTWAKCPHEAKAKALYQTGAKYHRAKDYRKAIVAFNKAQKLCPTVAMIYNIARAHDLIGNTDIALRLYEEYLKHKDPNASPINIQERIKTLRAAPPSWNGLYTDLEPPKVPTRPQPKVTPRWKRPWAWVATGAGAALLGTGAALLATRRVDEWQRNEDTGKLESVTDAWWPGVVLMGAGAVAGGLGVWLFARGETVSVMPTGTGISVAGVF